MSEQLRESLSAVIDGEAGEFELKRVLNELSTNDELRGAWDRYHLVRSLMRREPGRAVSNDLPERLWSRIEAYEGLDDSVSDAPGARARVGWLGPISGAAIAAAVAMAVVFGAGFGTEKAPEAVVASVVPLAPQMSTPAVIDLAPAAVLSTYPSRRDLQRTHAYMLHHAQHTALNGQGSMLPLAKVAAFETR